MASASAVKIIFAGLRDNSGDMLASGTVTFYQAGGTVLSTEVYDDAAMTTPASNPVTLSAYGKAEVYVNELVRMLVKDSDGNTIDDMDYLDFKQNVFDSVTVTSGLTLSTGSLTITSGNIIISSGSLRVPNGTVASPSIRIGDDSDGLYRVGSNDLGLSINNTRAWDVNASGMNMNTHLGYKTVSGITASTTQVQGNGELTGSINEISTCANIKDTVTLPEAVTGYTCTVINNGANYCKIYPASGDDLGNGVDEPTYLQDGESITFLAKNATTWIEVSSQVTIPNNFRREFSIVLPTVAAGGGTQTFDFDVMTPTNTVHRHLSYELMICGYLNGSTRTLGISQGGGLYIEGLVKGGLAAQRYVESGNNVGDVVAEFAEEGVVDNRLRLTVTNNNASGYSFSGGTLLLKFNSDAKILKV